jgi:isocitrate dehydrogenase (NAD+)
MKLMAHRITLIPGDGIGPEVSAAVLRIIDSAGVKIEWEDFIVGGEAHDRLGASLPEQVIESVRRNRVALKGPVATPIGTGFESVNVRLRKTLDLYANLRPVRNLPGVQSRFGDVDLVIVRENTEGLYSGLEHEVVPGVVESLKIMTEKACTRISVFAFEFARKYRRKKVTAVHKANIMKKSDGLFLQCFRNVAVKYPDIEHDEKIVDNTCMQLVMNPYQFDVLLMENLYGDIVSDLAAGLVGGLGVVPSANIGKDSALFEAVHGTAPDIAGKNLANPTALLMSSIMMLRHIGEDGAASRIESALNKVLQEKKNVTKDLGGNASCSQFTDAVIAAL